MPKPILHPRVGCAPKVAKPVIHNKTFPVECVPKVPRVVVRGLSSKGISNSESFELKQKPMHRYRPGKYRILETKIESALKNSLKLREEKIQSLESRLEESSSLNQQLRSELTSNASLQTEKQLLKEHLKQLDSQNTQLNTQTLALQKTGHHTAGAEHCTSQRYCQTTGSVMRVEPRHRTPRSFFSLDFAPVCLLAIKAVCEAYESTLIVSNKQPVISVELRVKSPKKTQRTSSTLLYVYN
ncbi:Girdin [Bagarius yarrelli]|uniref:Girdin n=1 Tax=Bagarius yarrelli TaxID=175774 RepID=A0A556VXL6_BAGYA|nr:Girdin [Bagarius yarrelli]